jgi:hypothetical protein
LKLAISSGSRDSRVMLAATHALKSGIIEARDQVAWNRLQLDALAADSAVSAGEHVEKLARWDGQLVALDGETDRLLKATDLVAALMKAVVAATALERGLSDAVKPLSVKEVRGDDLDPLRERCAAALQALAAGVELLRQTREHLAEATKADWKILKVAPGYLENRLSDLATLESQLKLKGSRIERINGLLSSAQSPRRGLVPPDAGVV